MLAVSDLREYHGAWRARGDSFLYAPPHPLLSPYISCYTLSFPTPATMSDAYAILPSVSATIIASAGDAGFRVHLRGVNTLASNVGAHANRMRMLLLIEFRPGALYPFLKIDQHELLDAFFPLDSLDPALSRSVARTAEAARDVKMLFEALDALLLARLSVDSRQTLVRGAVGLIRARRGNAGARLLSDEFHYGEKQLRRVFLERIGAGQKALARIARINYAARLLRSSARAHADIAAQAGYFDQPHLIRDFRAICGTTPLAFARNMSDFYNDAYKL